MEQKTETSQAVDEQWIFDLAAQYELPRVGLWGNVAFSSTGLVEFVRAALKAQPAPTEAQGDEGDGPEPSWRTSDISWILAYLKEHSIFDTARLRREWDEMRRIALAAQGNTSNNSSSSAQGEDSARLDAGCDCDSPEWCKNYNRCHRQVCGFELRGTTPKPV